MMKATPDGQRRPQWQERCVQVSAAVGLALAMMLVVATGWLQGRDGPSPHQRPGTCTECHLLDPDSNSDIEDVRRLVKDVDAVCKKCHDMDPGLSHPSNVPATMPEPEGFPFNWAGRITCATCHYMHREGQMDVTGYMIREEEVGRRFCENCHESLGGSGSRHNSTMSRSHVASETSAAFTRSILDPVSLQCLGCHDGTVARVADFRGPESRGAWDHTASIGLSHPIGVDYPPKGRKGRGYRMTEELDFRIRLFSGKLGCCSCHEVYTKEKHALVMRNDGSALCRACHIK